MTTLTDGQMNVLRYHSEAGDRIAYYTSLASFGIAYGELALAVVLNSTISGASANTFFLAQAANEGIAVSDDKLAEISLALMKADFAARERNIGVDLNVDDKQRYHAAVLDTFRISADAWAPNHYLTSFRKFADRQAAWEDMLNSSPADTFATIYAHFFKKKWLVQSEARLLNDPDYVYVAELQAAGFSGAFTPSGAFGPFDVAVSGTGRMVGGNTGADGLRGGDGNDIMIGFGGDDTFVGGRGDDVFYGNAGEDCADYTAESAGIVIQLGALQDGAALYWGAVNSGASVQRVMDENGAWDVLISIEKIQATAQDDVLQLHGSIEDIAGVEVVAEGGIDGGAHGPEGDTLDLSGLATSAGVEVFFSIYDTVHIIDRASSLLPAIDAWNFENAVGTDKNDIITGNEAANILDGGGGADEIYGGGGDDVIIFDAADTVVQGGAGYDRAEILEPESGGGSGAVVFASGKHGIEWLQGGSGGDVLTSNAVAWGGGRPADAEVYLELTAISWDVEGSWSSAEHYLAVGTDTRIIDYSGYNIVRGMGGNDTLVSSSTYDTIADGRTLLMGGSGDDEYRLTEQQMADGNYDPEGYHVTEIYDSDGNGRIMVGDFEVSGVTIHGPTESWEYYGDGSRGLYLSNPNAHFLAKGIYLSDSVGTIVVAELMGRDLWVYVGSFNDPSNGDDDRSTQFVIRDFRVGDFGIGFYDESDRESLLDDPDVSLRSDTLLSLADVVMPAGSDFLT
jgi:Ca2+-binding RTX toxin-like protein